jgi:hypothetical protein
MRLCGAIDGWQKLKKSGKRGEPASDTNTVTDALTIVT